jgi:hypothetical protein
LALRRDSKPISASWVRASWGAAVLRPYMRNAKCVTARGLTAEEQVQGYFAFCAFGSGDGLEIEIVEAIDAREVGGESLEDDGGFDVGFFPVGWRVFEGQGFGAGQSFRAACKDERFESFYIHFHERPGLHCGVFE